MKRDLERLDHILETVDRIKKMLAEGRNSLAQMSWSKPGLCRTCKLLAKRLEL